MKVSISWWDLAESDQTIESLRARLRGGWTVPWQFVRGLRLKVWVADAAGNRWGAFMLWESDALEADRVLPPHRAVELIGYPPTQRVVFDVEATVEGVFESAELSRLGMAFDGRTPPRN